MSLLSRAKEYTQEFVGQEARARVSILLYFLNKLDLVKQRTPFIEILHYGEQYAEKKIKQKEKEYPVRSRLLYLAVAFCIVLIESWLTIKEMSRRMTKLLTGKWRDD